MLSIQAVCGLPRLRAPGIVPCIISLAEASTREPVLVSSVITSTGSLAGIRHAHGFPCSSQPLDGCASAREPMCVPDTSTGPGTRAGITYSAADLLRKCSRSATVQAEIIRYSHQGY